MGRGDNLHKTAHAGLDNIVFEICTRVRTHNQKITAAARAIAERKTVGDLS